MSGSTTSLSSDRPTTDIVSPDITRPDIAPSGAAPAFRGTGPQGHRGRMRERLLSRGADTLADYEILEMLLFLGIPRRDTKPLAKELINRFGSLSQVLHADPASLARASLDAATIAVLRLPEEASRRLAAAEARDRPVLNDWERLVEYFDVALVGAVPGQLRALLLDNRNRLLADEAVTDAPDDVAQLLAGRALALHASALILVRVLPDGPIAPGLQRSEASMATAVAQAMLLLSITMHDHMLVGGGSWVSLRQKGLL